MALSPDQEQLEHELRVEQMQTNIEKMRADLRMESRKFVVQFVATIAVSVAAGVGLATYVEHHNTPTSIQSGAKP